MNYIIPGGWAELGVIYWYKLIGFWKVCITMLLLLIMIDKSRKSTEEDGLSTFQDKVPWPSTSFLNWLHSSLVRPSSPPIKAMPKRSSMNQDTNRILSQYFGINVSPENCCKCFHHSFNRLLKTTITVFKDVPGHDNWCSLQYHINVKVKWQVFVLI